MCISHWPNNVVINKILCDYLVLVAGNNRAASKYMYMCICVCMYVYVCLCICMCYTCMLVSMCVNMCMYLYLCLCVGVGEYV